MELLIITTERPKEAQSQALNYCHDVKDTEHMEKQQTRRGKLRAESEVSEEMGGNRKSRTSWV